MPDREVARYLAPQEDGATAQTPAFIAKVDLSSGGASECARRTRVRRLLSRAGAREASVTPKNGPTWTAYVDDRTPACYVYHSAEMNEMLATLSCR